MTAAVDCAIRQVMQTPLGNPECSCDSPLPVNKRRAQTWETWAKVASTSTTTYTTISLFAQLVGWGRIFNMLTG